MSRFGSLVDNGATFVLAGVRLVDGQGEGRVGDLAVVDGFIVDPLSVRSQAPRVDATNLVVAPGLCDLHVHLREPGDEGSETVESGARAAAHGGFTTICAMPNTDPPLDNAALVTRVRDQGRDAACRVRVVAAATRGRAGAEAADVEELAALGIVGVSDDGVAVVSRDVAEALLARLRTVNLPLIEHAEAAEPARGSVMRAGPTSTRLGLTGWPPEAESRIVERDIELAEEVGGWVHFTHVSTAASLEAIRGAKERGVHVTCDVTPHHLALTDSWVAGSRSFAWEDGEREPFQGSLDPKLAYDGACRVNPPLASRGDAQALLDGLADGTIDAIATDHAPHPPQRKAVEFGNAAPGMIGLDTALSIGLAAVEAGGLTLGRLIEALSLRPASLIGESRSLAIGQQADLVVFEPAARWRVEASALASASCNTPLIGRELPGVVRLTVVGGKITYRDGLAAI